MDNKKRTPRGTHIFRSSIRSHPVDLCRPGASLLLFSDLLHLVNLATQTNTQEIFASLEAKKIYVQHAQKVKHMPTYRTRHHNHWPIKAMAILGQLRMRPSLPFIFYYWKRTHLRKNILHGASLCICVKQSIVFFRMRITRHWENCTTRMLLSNLICTVQKTLKCAFFIE